MSESEQSLQDLREAVERKELEVRKKLLESNLTYYDNVVDPREAFFDGEDGWLPLGHMGVPAQTDSRRLGEVLPVYLSEHGLKALRDQCRRLLAYNEFAINAVESRINYIIGKGFQYRVLRRLGPARPDDALVDEAQRVLDEFHDAQEWGERAQECLRRCDRDGEAFLRLFPTARGLVEVRFIEPEHVCAPSTDAAAGFGVETAADDVEDVLAYHVIEDPGAGRTTTRVPAEEIVHIKLNVDSTAKRGLPTFLPVRKNLDRAEKLLRNMSVLAQVQATFALIRRHKSHSASAVDAFRQAQADASGTAPPAGKTSFLQRLVPGLILDAPDTTEYQFPAMQVAAGSLVQILQAELRAIAARLCMPEYMLSADASNANYASSLVAEAPAVRHFERLQAFYARRFGAGCFARRRRCGVMWRVLASAVEQGRLAPETLTDLEIQVEGQSLVARDRHAESRRHRLLHREGILSKPTWAKLEGLDFEQETKNSA